MAFAKSRVISPTLYRYRKNTFRILHRLRTETLVESFTALCDECTDHRRRQIGKQGPIESTQVILEPLQIMSVLHPGGLTETALTTQELEESRRRVDERFRRDRHRAVVRENQVE